MYTFVIQDIYQNYFVSKQYFETNEEAVEAAHNVAEYDFVYSIQVMKCEDVVMFNFINPVLN